MKGCKAGQAFYVVASFHLRARSSPRGPLTAASQDGDLERCHRLSHQCMSVDTQPHHDVLAVAIVGKTVRPPAHHARTLVVLHARDTGRLHRGDAVTSPSTSTAVRLDRASTGTTKHEKTFLMHRSVVLVEGDLHVVPMWGRRSIHVLQRGARQRPRRG